MWRARRFRLLLNLIDHLPRNSYYVQAVSNDPEHARLILKAQEMAQAEGAEVPKGPAMAWWSEEAEQLAGVRDLLKSLIAITLQANGAKNVAKPEPTPRPGTMLGKVKTQDRWAKHKELVARVLPKQ